MEEKLFFLGEKLLEDFTFGWQHNPVPAPLKFLNGALPIP